MKLLNMNVQVRSVSQSDMQSFSDKWVGKRVRVRRTGDIKTVVHAQMLMGEDLKLDDSSWVSPWEVDVITE
jgi:hypothetical protein